MKMNDKEMALAIAAARKFTKAQAICTEIREPIKRKPSGLPVGVKAHRGGYAARCTNVYGERVVLGQFATPDEAGEAYARAVRERQIMRDWMAKLTDEQRERVIAKRSKFNTIKF